MGLERRSDIGGIIGETFETIGENLVPIFIFVLVLGGATATAVLFGLIGDSQVQEVLGVEVTTNTPVIGGLFGAYAIALVILSVLASYFLLAEMLRSKGRLPNSGTRIWAYVGLTILSTIGFMIGLLLLVVPGIIVLVR